MACTVSNTGLKEDFPFTLYNTLACPMGLFGSVPMQIQEAYVGLQGLGAGVKLEHMLLPLIIHPLA